MIIRITTLCGLHAVADDDELDSLLGRRVRAAFFVYLAVERRATRCGRAFTTCARSWETVGSMRRRGSCA